MVVYPHISTNNDGVAMIDGTTTKVIEIVQDHFAHHWSADQIQQQYPYLNLAQIHLALAFYYDNQAMIDQQIDERHRRAEEIRSRRSDSSVRDKLKDLGHI